jgi:hypothetical protein
MTFRDDCGRHLMGKVRSTLARAGRPVIDVCSEKQIRDYRTYRLKYL